MDSKLNYNITYSEYLLESAQKTIDYTNYLAESVSNLSYSYSSSGPMKSRFEKIKDLLDESQSIYK